jgi:hypothetical protein
MQVASGASGSLLVIEAVGNGVILKGFQRVRKEWEAAYGLLSSLCQFHGLPFVGLTLN